MTRRAYDPERIYTPAADPTDGLDLFAQRAAAPDVATETPAPRPVARAAMRGGRETAYPKAIASLPRRQRIIMMVLQGTADGRPLTREDLVAMTGLRENSVNSAVHAMLSSAPPLLRVVDFSGANGRGRLAPVPPTAEDA